jgi:hypothetical protein
VFVMLSVVCAVVVVSSFSHVFPSFARITKLKKKVILFLVSCWRENED